MENDPKDEAKPLWYCKMLLHFIFSTPLAILSLSFYFIIVVIDNDYTIDACIYHASLCTCITHDVTCMTCTNRVYLPVTNLVRMQTCPVMFDP